MHKTETTNLQGNKVVEIKHADCTKGTEINRLLQDERYDFILAMGDDVTDEDMFTALPYSSYTIKVGNVSDNARFNILSQTEVLPFLSSLATYKCNEHNNTPFNLNVRIKSVLNKIRRIVDK